MANADYLRSRSARRRRSETREKKEFRETNEKNGDEGVKEF
jgi:hypothetical protein